jgi:hypothetical protein
MIRRLARADRGAAAVEFALIAPALFAIIFLVLEGGRMAFTQQTLQETAFAAARCFGLKVDGCALGDIRGWTVARARRSGLVIAPTTVEPLTPTTCNGRAGMSQITIASPYANAVGSILPAARPLMTVRACFPAS